MGLESGDKIGDLNASWPLGSDPKSQGDDHLRLLKTVFKNDVVPASTGGTFQGSLYITGIGNLGMSIKSSHPSGGGGGFIEFANGTERAGDIGYGDASPDMLLANEVGSDFRLSGLDTALVSGTSAVNRARGDVRYTRTNVLLEMMDRVFDALRTSGIIDSALSAKLSRIVLDADPGPEPD